MSLRDLGRVGFIGAGRLGQTLAVAWAQAGSPTSMVCSRSRSSAEALAQRLSHWQQAPAVADSPQAVVDASDTVFITVPDDQIGAVAASLSWRAGQVAVHCSGATELTALAQAQAAGAHAAGFHPLHTFGDVDTALAGLPGCSVAIEAADAVLHAALKERAVMLGAHPFTLPPGCRALYHASAHYAGSLVVSLMDEAVRHWGRFGVAPPQALAALLPLLGSTLRAMESRGLGPGMAGVVARGDVGSLRHHLQALSAVGEPEARLYADLSRLSVRLALDSGRLTAAQAHELMQALEGHGRLGSTAGAPPPRTL